MREPTHDELRRAAAKWQGASSTPCCEDRFDYFAESWRALPGLKKYVRAEVELSATKQE